MTHSTLSLLRKLFVKDLSLDEVVVEEEFEEVARARVVVPTIMTAARVVVPTTAAMTAAVLAAARARAVAELAVLYTESN